jgi:hypothetical protein
MSALECSVTEQEGIRAAIPGQREVGAPCRVLDDDQRLLRPRRACGVARGPELEHLRQELWNSEPREAIGGSLKQGSSIPPCIGHPHCKKYSLGAKGNAKNPDNARARPLRL